MISDSVECRPISYPHLGPWAAWLSAWPEGPWGQDILLLTQAWNPNITPHTSLEPKYYSSHKPKTQILLLTQAWNPNRIPDTSLESKYYSWHKPGIQILLLTQAWNPNITPDTSLESGNQIFSNFRNPNCTQKRSLEPLSTQLLSLEPNSYSGDRRLESNYRVLVLVSRLS